MVKVNEKQLGKLINTGLIRVYVPLFSFVVFCVILSYWYAKTILELNKSGEISAATMTIAVFVGWLWWSLKIVKWKIWAFSQGSVSDGYELYLRAIASGLIWPIGSVFNKTEIWTEKDKIKWLKIDREIREIFNTDTKTD